MSTLIHANIPVEEFALTETLQAFSEVIIEGERIVAGPNNTVMPLIWVRETTPTVFESAVAEDPTVTDDRLLIGDEERWLYEMRWTTNVRLVLDMLTNAMALVLDAVGSKDGWNLRVLFPNRDALSNTNEFCQDHGLTFEITHVRHLDPDPPHPPSPRIGLTDAQYKTLTEAYEQGYFDVPRRITLSELAAELDISHQALSERLRRGHNVLIQDILIFKENE